MIEELVIRPPSEAESVLLKATDGCSHNACSFCAAYRGVRFRVRDLKTVFAEIGEAASLWPDARRVFLGDGDAMSLSAPHLDSILERLGQAFPRLHRVGIYANARDILSKTDEQLAGLKARGLGIVYLGLESGDDEVLSRVCKGATAEEMVQAVVRAQAAGIKASVIALLGIAGPEGSRKHAQATGRIASRMNPRFFSCLTVMVVRGTPLATLMQKKQFKLPDPHAILQELRVVVENLDCHGTVFRSNHASNYLPLEGTLPKDKERLLAEIDACLRGETGMRPDFLRGL
ncbi:MAG: radical SAM protein [Elusimicrobiota bacterium]